VSCSGLDLHDRPHGESSARDWRSLHLALASFPVVLIGALERAAVAGGASLALACDLLVVGEEAFLTVPEVELGRPAPMNVAWLVAEHGPGRALEAVLGARRYRGRELVAAGIATEAVADTDVRLAGIGYPVDVGGHGGGPDEVAAVREESRGRVPPEDAVFGIGSGMGLSTLRDLAPPGLQRRFLRLGLRGEEIWCQLYSEPGVGSDLASLATRAVRDDDEWVVTQKVWTSGAQHSQLAVVLARTDPDAPKHRGITMLVLPMEQPGVTVRPLRQLTAIPFS
jgi:alkylation response protein AidB-like acyl-CoA dehydrogenase